MLINSLKTNTNPIHIKNHQTVIKPPQTVPIKNSALYTPKPNELCSRFNINFTSRLDEDKKLDEFCLRLENKIKEMTTPKDPEISSWVMTPEYLDLINETFKKDRIGNIYYNAHHNGISANTMLGYFSKNEQLKLEGDNLAFVVDEMSLEYLKKLNIDSFLEKMNNVKFYCLDTNEKETEKLIEEFNKLTNNSYEVTRIKRPENSNFSKSLDAKKIKAIIESYANIRFESEEQRKQFIDVITRYIDNNFLVFSYATLCEKLKELYKKIEKQVNAQGKTMDDVVYVVHAPYKSFGLINYLYAKTNSVPQSQFEILDAKSKIQEKGKIYVVMDDICASGSSMHEIIELTNYSDNFIYAPLIACKTGIEAVNETIKEKKLKNTKLIYSIKYNDLGFVRLCQFQRAYSNALPGYIEQLKNLNADDIDFLLLHTRGGMLSMHTFINFPYMISDNSSELNAFFGGYLLNNDDVSANKAINIFRRQELEYGEIKEIIENYYSNNP